MQDKTCKMQDKTSKTTINGMAGWKGRKDTIKGQSEPGYY